MELSKYNEGCSSFGPITTSNVCSNGSNGHLKMVIMVVMGSNTNLKEHNGSNAVKIELSKHNDVVICRNGSITTKNVCSNGNNDVVTVQ